MEKLSREAFTRQIVMAMLKLTPAEVLCLQDNVQERGFDLQLKTAAMEAAVLAMVRAQRAVAPLVMYEVLDMDQQNFRVVTVQVFDGNKSNQDMAAFLASYGELRSGGPVRPGPVGVLGRAEAVSRVAG